MSIFDALRGIRPPQRRRQGIFDLLFKKEERPSTLDVTGSSIGEFLSKGLQKTGRSVGQNIGRGVKTLLNKDLGDEIIRQPRQDSAMGSLKVTTRERDKFSFPDFEHSISGQVLRADLQFEGSGSADIVFHLKSPDGKIVSIPQTKEDYSGGVSYYGLELKIPQNTPAGTGEVWVTVNGQEVPGTRRSHEIKPGQPVDRYESFQKISPEQITSAIKTHGGENSPLLQYSNQLVKATEDFDFFRDNPFLLPTIAHLETGSGRNVTRPNNLLNWGINYPGNNEIFANMTMEEVLDRAITGLAKRDKAYIRFRTGKPLTDDELLDFASVYEPANDAYGPNLLRIIREMEGL